MAFWELARYELSNHAEFDDSQFIFNMRDIPTNINSTNISNEIIFLVISASQKLRVLFPAGRWIFQYPCNVLRFP